MQPAPRSTIDSTIDSTNDHADLLARAEAELAAINDALHRLDDGRYGRCEGCGESIAELDLEADPLRLRCRPCAGGEIDALNPSPTATDDAGVGAGPDAGGDVAAESSAGGDESGGDESGDDGSTAGRDAESAAGRDDRGAALAAADFAPPVAAQPAAAPPAGPDAAT